MQESKVEEITDIIEDIKSRYTPKNFKNMNLVVGRILKFNYEGSPVNLKITKIEKGRYWAEHVTLVDQTIVRGHYGHDVDITEESKAEYGAPYCTDCGVVVTEPATEDGEVKAQDRADRSLSDGTIIE